MWSLCWLWKQSGSVLSRVVFEACSLGSSKTLPHPVRENQTHGVWPGNRACLVKPQCLDGFVDKVCAVPGREHVISCLVVCCLKAGWSWGISADIQSRVQNCLGQTLPRLVPKGAFSGLFHMGSPGSNLQQTEPQLCVGATSVHGSLTAFNDAPKS